LQAAAVRVNIQPTRSVLRWRTLPEAAGGLDPAERFLDALAQALAGGVAEVAGGATSIAERRPEVFCATCCQNPATIQEVEGAQPMSVLKSKHHPGDRRAMAAYFCYVAVPSREAARALGRTVVEERLAACANVLDGMASVYWWRGNLEEASEAALILKTRAELIEQLTARIRDLHPYECPGVVALPIAAGNPAYLEWIAGETAPALGP